MDFSLDDFGTGYSSLLHLRHLAAEELKIDQRFVRDMLTDPEAMAIVEGIISLGRAFRRGVVAEGVEKPEQSRKLLELGCTELQGYLYAHPMPAADMPGWIKAFRLPAEKA
ncbi:MAG: EAL domain-containing protein [Candidatus Methylumidiphilus sp.]